MGTLAVPLLWAVILESSFIIGQARLSDMRSVGAFAALRFAALALIAVFWDMDGLAQALAMSLVYALLPFLFYEGRTLHRISSACLGGVAVFTAQVTGMCVWDASTGGIPPTGSQVVSHPDAVCWSSIGCLLMFLAVITLFRNLVKPFRPSNPDVVPIPSKDHLLLVIIPLSQVGLSTLLAGNIYGGPSKLDLPSVLTFLIACVFVASCTLITVHAGKRYKEALESKRDVEELKGLFQETISSYDAAIKGIESTAKVRHDLQNQLWTVMMLVGRGELDSARLQLENLEASLNERERERERELAAARKVLKTGEAR